MWRISNRLNLIKGFFSPDRDFPFAMIDMLKGVVKQPCTRIGPAFVKKIDEEEDHLIVKLRSEATALYWPRSLLISDLYKVITECFSENDWHFYDVPETRVLPGEVVIDCGASEGAFTLRVLRRAAHIVAFEPLPLFVSSMRKTFSQSPNVTIVPAALGSAEGTAILEGPPLRGAVERNGGEGVPIKVTTIDEYVKSTGIEVDFIKADVEGFELEVLRGAENTIKKFRPKMAFTVYHPGNNWRQIREFIRGLVPQYSYRLKGISYNKGVARPVMIHLWVD
jgi:FkbM family methyltransferase